MNSFSVTIGVKSLPAYCEMMLKTLCCHSTQSNYLIIQELRSLVQFKPSYPCLIIEHLLNKLPRWLRRTAKTTDNDFDAPCPQGLFLSNTDEPHLTILNALRTPNN